MMFTPGVRAAAMHAAILASTSRVERLLYLVERELSRAYRVGFHG